MSTRSNERAFMVQPPTVTGKTATFGSSKLVAPSLLVALCTSGCETVASLNGPLTDGRPLVMSGTRFDLAALDDRERAEARFRTPPPSYPLLDLPFSAVLDFLALGFTLPTAAVLKVLNR